MEEANGWIKTAEKMQNSHFLWFAVVVFCCKGIAEGYWLYDWWVKPGRRGFVMRESDVTFQLFVRKNAEKGVRLIVGDVATLLSSGFNNSLPTKILTHGYMDNGKTWILTFKSEVLKADNVNFISVDWSKCAKNILYDRVVVCMREASHYLGQLLKFLFREGGLNLRETHMIGHSLGAHMVALAARNIPAKGAIGRITGLDPAAPLIEHRPESERLNPTSARFVDVIHTASFFVGITKPIGTVDFYPNGGYFQPGCRDLDLRCHHRASQYYFLNTIKKTQRYWYSAKKCESLQNALNGTCSGELAFMGYDSVGSSPGIYYSKVLSDSPFIPVRVYTAWRTLRNALGNPLGNYLLSEANSIL